jgi:cytochrome bd-type quinol oxidase subunit 2
MIVVGSFLPALLWGVAFGNIVRGVPIEQDGEFGWPVRRRVLRPAQPVLTDRRAW